MQNSYHDISDEIYNTLEALFGSEIWTDSTMLDKAVKLNEAGLTHKELTWTQNNRCLPSKFSDIFK